jgi:hypothetical protein
MSSTPAIVAWPRFRGRADTFRNRAVEAYLTTDWPRVH